MFSRTISAISAVFFAAFVVWGSLSSSMFEQSGAILEMVWGQIMLVDLYLGFLVFLILVQYIERCWRKALAWFVPTLILGNVVPMIYISFYLFRKRKES